MVSETRCGHGRILGTANHSAVLNIPSDFAYDMFDPADWEFWTRLVELLIPELNRLMLRAAST
jgi:hypothetical protein